VNFEEDQFLRKLPLFAGMFPLQRGTTFLFAIQAQSYRSSRRLSSFSGGKVRKLQGSHPGQLLRKRPGKKAGFHLLHLSRPSWGLQVAGKASLLRGKRSRDVSSRISPEKKAGVSGPGKAGYFISGRFGDPGCSAQGPGSPKQHWTPGWPGHLGHPGQPGHPGGRSHL